jgi:hypothetical protein
MYVPKASFWGQFTREGRLKNQWAKGIEESDPERGLNLLRQVQQKLMKNPAEFPHLWLPFLDTFLDGNRVYALTNSDMKSVEEMGDLISQHSDVPVHAEEVWLRALQAYDRRKEKDKARELLTHMYNASASKETKVKCVRDLAKRGAEEDDQLKMYIDYLQHVPDASTEGDILKLLSSQCAADFDSDSDTIGRAGGVAERLLEGNIQVLGLDKTLGLKALLKDEMPSRAVNYFKRAFQANPQDRMALVGLLSSTIKTGEYGTVEKIIQNTAYSDDNVVKGLVNLSATLQWLNDPEMAGSPPCTTQSLSSLDIGKYVGEAVESAVGILHLLEGDSRQAVNILLPLAERHPEQYLLNYYAAWAASLTDDREEVARLFTALSKWNGRWTVACLLLDSDPALAEVHKVQSDLNQISSSFTSIIQRRLALSSGTFVRNKTYAKHSAENSKTFDEFNENRKLVATTNCQIKQNQESVRPTSAVTSTAILSKSIMLWVNQEGKSYFKVLFNALETLPASKDFALTYMGETELILPFYQNREKILEIKVDVPPLLPEGTPIYLNISVDELAFITVKAKIGEKTLDAVVDLPLDRQMPSDESLQLLDESFYQAVIRLPVGKKNAAEAKYKKARKNFTAAARRGEKRQAVDYLKKMKDLIAKISPSEGPMQPFEEPVIEKIYWKYDAGASIAENMEAFRTALGYAVYDLEIQTVKQLITMPMFQRLPLADQRLWCGLYLFYNQDPIKGCILLEEAAIKFGYKRAALILSVHFLEQNRVKEAEQLLDLAAAGRRDNKIELLRAYIEVCKGKTNSAAKRLDKLAAKGEAMAHYALGNLNMQRSDDARISGDLENFRLFSQQAASSFRAALRTESEHNPSDCRVLEHCAEFIANPEREEGSYKMLWHEVEQIDGHRQTSWLVWNAFLSQLRWGSPFEIAKSGRKALPMLESVENIEDAAMAAVASNIAYACITADKDGQVDELTAQLGYLLKGGKRQAIKPFYRLGVTASARMSYLKVKQRSSKRAKQKIASLAECDPGNGSLALVLAQVNLKDNKLEEAEIALRNANPEDAFEQNLCTCLASLLRGDDVEWLPQPPPSTISEVVQACHLLRAAVAFAAGDRDQGYESILEAMKCRDQDLKNIFNFFKFLPALCLHLARETPIPQSLIETVRSISVVDNGASVARCAAAIGDVEYACRLWDQIVAKEPNSPSISEYSKFLCHLAVSAYNSGDYCQTVEKLRAAAVLGGEKPAEY